MPQIRSRTFAAHRTGAALAFVLAAAAASPAAADGAATVTRWFEELAQVKGLTVRHGAITDEADGRTVARDLDVSFKTAFDVGFAGLGDKYAVSLEGRWRLPVFEVTDLVETADGYRAATVSMPEQSFEVTGAAAGEQFRASIALTDVAMRDGAWPRLPDLADDPARPVSRFGPLLEAMAQQDWAEQSVARIETLVEGGDAKQVQVIGPVRYTGVVDGRVAEVATEDYATTTTTTVPGQDGGAPVTVVQRQHMRRGVAIGYDVLPAVRAVFGLDQSPTRSIVVESVREEDITSSGAGPSTKIAASEIRGVRIGTPAVPLATVYDRVFVDGTVAIDTLFDAMLATVEVTGIDEAAITGLVFDGIEDASSGTRYDAHGKIAEMRMDGFADLAIRGVSVSGVDLSLPDAADVTLDRFALSDIALPSRAAVVEAVRIGFAAEAAEAANAKAREKAAAASPDQDNDGVDAADDADGSESMDGAGQDSGDVAAAEVPVPELSTRQALDIVPTLGGIEIAGLTVTRTGEPSVGLASFRALFSNFVAPIPTNVAIDLAGLHVPAALVEDPDVRDTLARFGAMALDVDARLALTWDEGSGDYALDPFEVAVGHVGRYTSRVKLGNVPRSVFENPETAQAALPEITFEGSSSALSDAPGLTDYIASLAREAGVSPHDLIEGFAEQARDSLASQAGDVFANKAADAVRGFLSDPGGSIVVTAAPTTPVPLATLLGSAVMSPGAIVSLLNVTISVGRRL